MKTIGLIGGLSWHSTVEYYRIINEEVHKLLGGRHSARMAIYSVDFSEHLEIHEQGGWDKVAQEMIDIAEKLKTVGADFLLLGANTAHMVADKVETAVELPLLHIADVTAKAIKDKGLRRVGLLGTRHTMREDFYRRRLQNRHGLEVVIPEPEDVKVIDVLIFDKLVKGDLKAEYRNVCLEVMQRLVAAGAEGIILGCTELPLLIQPEHIDITLFDTLKIHARAAAEWALRD